MLQLNVWYQSVVKAWLEFNVRPTGPADRKRRRATENESKVPGLATDAIIIIYLFFNT